jgi:hypothetical protein
VRLGAALALWALASAPVLAADVGGGAAILARTPEADGIFAVQPDGSLRHLQSGLICRVKYPDVSLVRLEVFKSNLGPGADVGCDYARPAAGGGDEAELTVFATKMTAGETLDSVYSQRLAEVRSREGKSEARPAVSFEGGGERSAVRSAEFDLMIGGRAYLSDVIVSVKAGWSIEVRATYPKDVVLRGDRGPEEAAEKFDAPVPLIAWLQADSSVGQGSP